MNFAEHYFSKHTYLLPELKEPPSGLLYFSVVIPVYLEGDLELVLETLIKSIIPEGRSIEVLLIFNHSEADTHKNKEENKVHYQRALSWCKRNSLPRFSFHPIFVPDLPKKHAGAGLARKIGMDLALMRYNQLDAPEGLILSLDADTLIEPGYFDRIDSAMSKNLDAGGCILSFAHPVEGDEFDSQIYNAITQYELHLRYYKHILDFAGFPWSNYTIGSCFGVRAEVYAKQGGMNRQKAGEDFYFLNKLFPHTKFITVTDTCVHPSPRVSLRVPFGTGPVIQRMVAGQENVYLSYMPEAFFDLKELFDSINDLAVADQGDYSKYLCRYNKPLQQFLVQHRFEERLTEIKGNTSNEKAFRKRFFLWFDGFRVVKYLNFVHEHHFSKIPVQQAASELLKKVKMDCRVPTPKGLLELFRTMDREGVKFNQEA